MAYMDIAPARGKKTRGTVLLLHGKNFSGTYWKDTIAALSEAGYRDLVPDQVGFGKSSQPLRFQYSFQVLASATRALLDQLKTDKVAATLLRAPEACKNKGAARIFGVITHALFGPGSEQLYRAGRMDQIFVTDRVTPQ